MRNLRDKSELADRKDWLRWFLDFINLDLQGISKSKRGKLALDVHILLANQGVIDEAVFANLGFAWEAEADSGESRYIEEWRSYCSKSLSLERFQSHLKDFFAQTMKNVESVRKFIGEDHKDFMAVSKTPFENPNRMALNIARMEITFSLQVRPIATESIWVDAMPEQVRISYDPEVAQDTPVKLAFKATTDEDTLLFWFIRLLEDVPLSSFRACQECGKWFIHLTKREKQFCSNSCAARFGVRMLRAKKREENTSIYKEELKTKSKRSHDAYVKKVKSRVPNAKIVRRPLKHKEEED